MLYVGLDLALGNTGLVILNHEGEITHAKLIKTKKSGYKRLPDIRDQIITTIPEPTFCVVGLENYSYASRNQAHQLGELGGVVRVALLERAYKVHPIPPTTLKKYVTGKGNAGKSQVILSTYKKWDVELVDDNLCDAYGLARMVWGMDNSEKVLKYQEDILKQIREKIIC